MTLAVALLALVVFVLCGIVYELFRDVRQLRDATGILDRPLQVDLGTVAGSRPSSHGLPEVLDTASSALVLFLSDRCGTCRSIAAGLGRQVPPELWVVLEARTPESATEFIAFYDLMPLAQDGRLLVDVAGEIAARIGLDLTPVGFRVESGQIASATTVPSRRYLFSILPKPIRLKRVESVAKESDLRGSAV